jgi:hypothetical protein
MTTTKRLEPMLWLSDARGIYIPRDWANSFSELATISGIEDDTLAILRAGPDHEQYWEAWEEVLDRATVRDDKGNVFTVYQDGDCWLIPEGMVWDEETEFFAWPSEEG